MESTSEPMKIQVSEEFKTRLLEQGAKYRFVERGDGSGVFIKGKGNMKTFWLLRGNPNDIDDV